MKHEELTHKIISCAYKVYNTLGFGLLESIYKKGMVIELTKSTLKAEAEKPLQVFYDNQAVGDFHVDLFVEDQIVVELKSVEQIKEVHKKQLLTYLRLANKELGLLINFNVPLFKDGITRIANSLCASVYPVKFTTVRSEADLTGACPVEPGSL